MCAELAGGNRSDRQKAGARTRKFFVALVAIAALTGGSPVAASTSTGLVPGVTAGSSSTLTFAS